MIQFFDNSDSSVEFRAEVREALRTKGLHGMLDCFVDDNVDGLVGKLRPKAEAVQGLGLVESWERTKSPELLLVAVTMVTASTQSIRHEVMCNLVRAAVRQVPSAPLRDQLLDAWRWVRGIHGYPNKEWPEELVAHVRRFHEDGPDVERLLDAPWVRDKRGAFGYRAMASLTRACECIHLAALVSESPLGKAMPAQAREARFHLLMGVASLENEALSATVNTLIANERIRNGLEPEPARAVALEEMCAIIREAVPTRLIRALAAGTLQKVGEA